MTRRKPGLEPVVTIPVVFVCGMLSGLIARGESIEIYLRDAGIPKERLSQSDARVTVEQYLALFRSLSLRRNDAMLGLLSRPFRRGSIGMIVRAGVSGHDLFSALRRMARTINLLQDDLVLQTCVDGRRTGLAIRLLNVELKAPNFLHELMLRVLWRILAWLAGDGFRAARFDFAYPVPDYVDDYAQLFPAPFRFDCERSAFWVDTRLLKGPVRQIESSVPQFLNQSQAYVVYRRSISDSTSNRLRGLMQAMQPGWPDLVECAGQLHVSPATLQRRLSAEGTSFQSIKDELRRDLAIQRLHASRDSIEQLASELGFSSRDSFHHAFKKWTGSSPGDYRTRH